MKNIKTHLVLFGLLLPVSGMAQDIFAIFDEPMSATMDIFIRKLDYQRSENELEPQGSFSFERFKIVSDKTNVQLHNESHFYDAQIYRRDRLIGFQGPAASFAYRLNEDDFGYINSFQWMNMEDVGFFMDRTRIQLSGKNLAMREPQYTLLASNLDLNCERHPDYILNNGEGFLSGCFNFAEATPLSGQGAGVDFKYYSPEGVKLVDFQAFSKSVRLEQEQVVADITSISANFSEQTLVNATDLKVSCQKEKDLLKMNPETFVVPCLEEIELEGNFLRTSFLEEDDQMTVLSPRFSHHNNELVLDHEELKFKTVDSEFKLTGSVLKCNTPKGLDLLEVETFMQGCLNDSKLLEKEEAPRFSYSIEEKEGEDPLVMNVQADVHSFLVSEDRIDLTSNKLQIDVANEIFIDIDDVIWGCQKVPGINEFDAKGMLDHCKNGLELDVNNFLIKDFADAEKPILAGAKPKVVKNLGGILHLEVPRLKLVDREDLTVMKDLQVLCKTEGKTDVFIPNEIIEACVKRGQIKVDKLFTDDSTLSPSQIMAPNMNLDNVRISEKDPKLFDISITTDKGIVYFELRTKILGIKSKIRFSGPIAWDMENEVITIKVENSRLPLGIKSENIFMFFLKKMLVAEMVTYEKGHTIKIQL